MAQLMTDRTALNRARARASRIATRDNFLLSTAADEIEKRLELVNRSFTDIAIVTGFPAFWTERFPKAQIVPDDDVLDLQTQSFDLVIHAMALHWANDPVGQLIQCARALKPDGLLLSISLGGETLIELRQALAQAETMVSGGLSPRVAPMGDLRDMGSLLQRAGLALPVADSFDLSVSYATLNALMQDLRDMGEVNVLNDRRKVFARKALFQQAEAMYQSAHGDEESRLPATFEFVCLTGWSPHASQQKPLRPGSATARLADALNSVEKAANDPVPHKDIDPTPSGNR